jgi:hypothetical protein
MDAPRIAKKWMYRATGTTLAGEIAAINKAYLKERRANFDSHRRRAWADWLRVQATNGDKEALEALRARHAGHAPNGNAFWGERKPVRAKHAERPGAVTKNGSLIYSCGATAVRDDGQSITVSGSLDEEGLRAALAIAQERFGSRIAVRGSEVFREQIALAAATGKLGITFDDNALELRHRAIVRENSAKARTEARRQRNTPSVMAMSRDAVWSEKSSRPAAGPATGTGAPTCSAVHALADPSLSTPVTGMAIDVSRGGTIKRNGRSR